jgi:hypothetical protein
MFHIRFLATRDRYAIEHEGGGVREFEFSVGWHARSFQRRAWLNTVTYNHALRWDLRDVPPGNPGHAQVGGEHQRVEVAAGTGKLRTRDVSAGRFSTARKAAAGRKSGTDVRKGLGPTFLDCPTARMDVPVCCPIFGHRRWPRIEA